ncbi:MAG TPA: hypothetical protein VEC11_17145 [Allosphingosinicella sp.]|nr:hypothetical protein [Allosphingosinicella sp.]
MTERPDPLAFAPVPVRPRRDGWTVDRQIAFIETLAETGCVTTAARSVGMSVRSAYRLAARPDARAFSEAWDTAMAIAARSLAALAFDYATGGMVEQVWKDGVLVSERRRPSERLLIFLLSRHDPVRYGTRPAPLEGQDDWPRDFPQRSLGEHFEAFRDIEIEGDPEGDDDSASRART